MKGAHSAKKKGNKASSPIKATQDSKAKKKAKKSGVVLRVDPEIIKATMTPKPASEEKSQDAKGTKPKEGKKRDSRAKHKKKGGKKPVVVIVLAVIALILVGVAVAFAAGVIEFPKSASDDSQPVVVSNGGSGVAEGDLDQSAGALQEEGQPDDAKGVADTPSEYVNQRFGFSVPIPDGFIIDSEFDNGDGVLLVNGAMNMIVQVSGSNNVDDRSAQQIMESLWNGSDDSIRIAEGNRIIIYQYDETTEYFYWIYVGAGSINQMKIEYPAKDNNQIDLDTAQILMQGFVPGNINRAH